MNLVEGKIPANTVCPFKNQCELAEQGKCHHRGTSHSQPFSCAMARAFEITSFPKETLNNVG